MPKVRADQTGSMLPLFVVFVMLFLWLAASAANLSAITLQTQRLQAEADQAALAKYENQKYEIGQTAEFENCTLFELPIKLIGLPAAHQICVQSAAR